jgi:hypothetical protein
MSEARKTIEEIIRVKAERYEESKAPAQERHAERTEYTRRGFLARLLRLQEEKNDG